MDYQVGMKFSTRGHDSDTMASRDCAATEKGGWWYKGCSKANLMGEYYEGPTELTSGITWFTFKGFFYSLKSATMSLIEYHKK